MDTDELKAAAGHILRFADGDQGFLLRLDYLRKVAGYILADLARREQQAKENAEPLTVDSLNALGACERFDKYGYKSLSIPVLAHQTGIDFENCSGGEWVAWAADFNDGNCVYLCHLHTVAEAKTILRALGVPIKGEEPKP